METMTETGTEKRVDELSKRVDDVRGEMRRGFDRADGEFRELRTEIKDLRTETKQGFAALEEKFDAKFDSLNRTIIYLLGGSLSVMTSGIIAAAFHALF